MNLYDGHALRRLRLDRTWLDHVRAFGRGLATSHVDSGRLLLVGTLTDDPWHLAAHLTAQAELQGLPHLVPTLIRHHVPAGVPAHRAFDLSHLAHAARGHTILVVAGEQPDTELLSRLNDARHAGATLLAINADASELDDLAHDTLTAAPSVTRLPVVSGLDLTQHLVAVSTTAPHRPRRFRRSP